MANSPLKAYFRRWITIRDQPGPVEALCASLLCIAATLGLWYVLTAGKPEDRIIDPVTLPSLGDTLRSFPTLWLNRALSRSALWSLGRVFGGFALATSIAAPLGIIAGSFLRLNFFLRPLSIFGRNIPVAALIPLTLIWFGIGESQKVMFIFLASVAFILFDSINAVQSVPDSYLDAAYTLGARFTPKDGAIRAAMAAVLYGVVFVLAYGMLSQTPGVNDAALWAAHRRWQIISGLFGAALGASLWFPIMAFQPIRKVLFPLSMPDVMNSLRLLFGLAFGYIMLAEVINAEFGLGAIINISQRQGPREHIYLCLMLIAALAFGIDRAALSLQRWLFPYRAMGD